MSFPYLVNNIKLYLNYLYFIFIMCSLSYIFLFKYKSEVIENYNWYINILEFIFYKSKQYISVLLTNLNYKYTAMNQIVFPWTMVNPNEEIYMPLNTLTMQLMSPYCSCENEAIVPYNYYSECMHQVNSIHSQNPLLVYR